MKECGFIANYAKGPENIATANGEKLGQEKGWLCHWKSGSVQSEILLEACVLDLGHWCTYIYR